MRLAIVIVIASMIVLVSATFAGEDTAFDEVVRHYEAIRQVLIEDSTEGIAEHAEGIAAAADGLDGDFKASVSGVSTEDAAAVKALLPEIADRAGRVADADNIEAIRTELAEMTKPLVRWHGLVEGSKPVVAYCPMEKKAWLQPDEAIGNPYAPYMLRCGEVVQR